MEFIGTVIHLATEVRGKVGREVLGELAECLYDDENFQGVRSMIGIKGVLKMVLVDIKQSTDAYEEILSIFGQFVERFDTYISDFEIYLKFLLILRNECDDESTVFKFVTDSITILTHYLIKHETSVLYDSICNFSLQKLTICLLNYNNLETTTATINLLSTLLTNPKLNPTFQKEKVPETLIHLLKPLPTPSFELITSVLALCSPLQTLAYPQLLQIPFYCLPKLPKDQRPYVLMQVNKIIIEDKENANKVLEAGFLRWIHKALNGLEVSTLTIQKREEVKEMEEFDECVKARFSNIEILRGMILNVILNDMRMGVKVSQFVASLKFIPTSVDYFQAEVLTLLFTEIQKFIFVFDDPNSCKNLVNLLSNIDEILAFRPQLGNLILQSLLNITDVGVKAGLAKSRDQLSYNMIRSLASYNNKGGYWSDQDALEAIKLIDFDTIIKSYGLKHTYAVQVLLNYLFQSSYKEGQLYTLDLLRKLCTKKDFLKLLKSCMTDNPKLVTIFTVDPLNYSRPELIVQEIPTDEIELSQLFLTIDSIVVSDPVAITLIQKHQILLIPTIEKLNKVLSPIEKKTHEEQIKSYEKRSKNRIKQIEQLTDEKSIITGYIDQHQDKIQNITKKLRVELDDIFN